MPIVRYRCGRLPALATARSPGGLQRNNRGLEKVERVKREERRAGQFDQVLGTVKAMLAADPGLEAKTIMQFLLEEYPGRFHVGQLRTLQQTGASLENYRRTGQGGVFRTEVHEPARQSQSDFTNCGDLEITINREPFPHLLFHFMLPYSRWETFEIAFSESYANLTNGYAKAAKELGGCAKVHRTDNLAAAVQVDENGNARFTERWIQFLEHYGVRPSRSNAWKSNENGSMEKSHDLLKKAIRQRLKLRKSRDFATQELYEEFVRGIVQRLNQGREKKILEEKMMLKPVPKHEWSDAREVFPKVTSFSTITVCKAVYSVPSRFIGVDLRALVYADTVKVYYDDKLVQEMPRLPAGGVKINYRHLISSLVRKPGAFSRYQYRKELFPSLIFRRTMMF